MRRSRSVPATRSWGLWWGSPRPCAPTSNRLPGRGEEVGQLCDDGAVVAAAAWELTRPSHLQAAGANGPRPVTAAVYPSRPPCLAGGGPPFSLFFFPFPKFFNLTELLSAFAKVDLQLRAFGPSPTMDALPEKKRSKKSKSSEKKSKGEKPSKRQRKASPAGRDAACEGRAVPDPTDPTLAPFNPVITNARPVCFKELPPVPDGLKSNDVTLVFMYQYVEPIWNKKQHRQAMDFIVKLGNELEVRRGGARAARAARASAAAMASMTATFGGAVASASAETRLRRRRRRPRRRRRNGLSPPDHHRRTRTPPGHAVPCPTRSHPALTPLLPTTRCAAAVGARRRG